MSPVGVADDSENLLIWPNHLLDMSTGFVWCSVYMYVYVHCIYMYMYMFLTQVMLERVLMHVYTYASTHREALARLWTALPMTS